MGWHSSQRRAELPPDWWKRRGHVLKRDGHQCRHTRVDTGERCTEVATDVDHIEPGSNHGYENLQALCRWHHNQKTAREAAAARAASPRYSKRRPPDDHPGLLP